MADNPGMAVRFIEGYTVVPATEVTITFGDTALQEALLTPEQQAAYNERCRVERERYDAYRKQVAEREQRGLARLKSFLTEKQRVQLERHTYFEVVGSHSKQTYRVYWGSSGNVFLMDGDVRSIGYCAGPEGDMAIGDIVLAQKLQLECDETAFLGVANPTYLDSGPARARARVREWLNRR